MIISKLMDYISFICVSAIETKYHCFNIYVLGQYSMFEKAACHFSPTQMPTLNRRDMKIQQHGIVISQRGNNPGLL